MDGTELAIRFSYQPNALCYCGPKDANRVFHEYLSSGENREEVLAAFKRFEGLWPYLQMFAERSGKDVLAPEVVEAYWLGNSLSERCGIEDLKGVLDVLATRGLPRSLAESLKEGLPEGFFPTHAFHVLYVGPGNTAGTVQPTLPTKDQCLITWGKVVRVGGQLTVLRRPLILKDGLYAFGAPENRTAHYEPAMLDVREGDIVGLHWGLAFMKLSADQLARLEKHNLHAVDVMNEYLQSSRA